MKKNIFKKSSIMDSLTNVGVGGAANAAVDYAMATIPGAGTIDELYINAGKIAVGAIVGSMVTNKFARAAADGLATVGVSQILSGLINSDNSNGGGSGEGSQATSGLARGTIGRSIPGNRRYMRSIKGIGASANAFMGK